MYSAPLISSGAAFFFLGHLRGLMVGWGELARLAACDGALRELQGTDALPCSTTWRRLYCKFTFNASDQVLTLDSSSWKCADEVRQRRRDEQQRRRGVGGGKTSSYATAGGALPHLAAAGPAREFGHVELHSKEKASGLW